MASTEYILSRLIADDWAALESLLQSVHPRPNSVPYVYEYPLMLSPQNIHQSFGVKAPESQELLAHIGTLPRDLMLGEVRLKVALIGSVATAPSCRGLGLASKLLNVVHQALAADGTLLTFLWSEDRPLYQRAGYHPVGTAHLFALTSSPPTRSVSGIQLRVAEPRDIEVLVQHRPGYGNQLLRSPEEHRTLLQIPHMQVYVLQEAGTVQAALYVGKGSDFQDIAHEWWGEEAALLQLLAFAYAQRGNRLGLLTSSDSSGLYRVARDQGWPSIVLPQAQVCILNYPALLKQLRLALPREELEQHLFGTPADTNADTAHPRPPYPIHFWGLDSM